MEYTVSVAVTFMSRCGITLLCLLVVVVVLPLFQAISVCNLTLIIGTDDGAIGAALVVVETDPFEWLVSTTAACVLDWGAAGALAVLLVIETGLGPEGVVVLVEHVMLSVCVLDELHITHEELLFA